MKRWMMRAATLLLTAVLLLNPAAMAELSRGDRGEDVMELQQMLYDLGWLFEVPDGIFGAKTESAVKKFEQYASLPVDGIADDLMIYELSVSFQMMIDALGVGGETVEPDSGIGITADGREVGEAFDEAMGMFVDAVEEGTEEFVEDVNGVFGEFASGMSFGLGGIAEAFGERLENAAAGGNPDDLGVICSSDSCWEYGDEGVLSEVYWEMLSLDDAAARRCPELAATLEAMNGERSETMEALSAELAGLAREAFGDGGEAYCSSSFMCYVRRADTAVLSFRADVETFTGGAHPEYGTVGYNLDPATGEEIALSTVIPDRNRLIPLLAERLLTDNPGIYIEDPEGTLRSLTEEELEWTLDPEGITFYFNPYVILPYAAGKMTATIRYDEAPELFNPEYLPVSGSAYAVRLPFYEIIRIETGSGQRSLTVSPIMGEYEAYDQIMITLDGMECTGRPYAYELTAYLVTGGTEGGRKSWLYLDTVGDNGYSTLMVYDLNGEVPGLVCEYQGVGFPGSSYSGRPAKPDPTGFVLDTHLEIIGTHFGWQEYSVDFMTGLPVPAENFYNLDYNGYPFTSLIPLQATITDTQTEETIPAGTEFCKLRTDGETYMDFRLDDGRECRIYVDTSEYPYRINGVDEYECFDGFVYAG